MGSSRSAACCRSLHSTYYRHKAQQQDPAKRSARAREDEELRKVIYRIWTEQRRVYGHRNVYKQMGYENLRAARCRVRRLMREMGLKGATRGRAWSPPPSPRQWPIGFVIW